MQVVEVWRNPALTTDAYPWLCNCMTQSWTLSFNITWIRSKRNSAWFFFFSTWKLYCHPPSHQLSLVLLPVCWNESVRGPQKRQSLEAEISSCEAAILLTTNTNKWLHKELTWNVFLKLVCLTKIQAHSFQILNVLGFLTLVEIKLTTDNHFFELITY